MRMLRALLLHAFVSLAVVSAAHADSVMVNHKEAKIRSGPATVYTILWKPRMYTPLEVLAKFTDRKGQLWYVVRDVEGDVGWIYHSVVETKQSVIVTSKLVSVREEPDPKSRILFQAPKNYTFKVVEKKKDWYRVEDPEGDKGWIEAKGVWDGNTPAVKKPSRKK